MFNVEFIALDIAYMISFPEERGRAITWCKVRICVPGDVPGKHSRALQVACQSLAKTMLRYQFNLAT